MIAELNETLSKLDAKSCKTENVEKDNEQLFVVIAEYVKIFDSCFLFII